MNHCSSRLTAFAVALLVIGPSALATTPDLVQLRPELLEQTRAAIAAGTPDVLPAYQALIASADGWMEVEPPAVTDKIHPAPSGDPHDYASLQSYQWPDPKKPDGLPWVFRDGERNPLGEEYDRPKLKLIQDAVPDLSLAAWFSGETRYADKAAAMLRTFFLDPATRMNPNLNHAQFSPGGPTGTRYGIIDTAYFPSKYFFDAVTLLPFSADWTEADLVGMREWFGQFLDWLETSELGRDLAENQHNNIRTGYELQRAAIARFIGDDARAMRILEDFGPNVIARQIQPDGSQPDEEWRSKSLGYSAKNVEFLLQVAQLGELVGVDLHRYEAPNGASIRLALDSLIPYWTGDKVWKHEQIRDFRSNRARDALRWAAIGYDTPRYEALIGEVEGNPEADWTTDRVQLLWPANK